MCCDCYEDGYTDGRTGEVRDHECDVISKLNSVDLIINFIFKSPWALHKVKDIFDSRGWVLSRK